MTTGMLAVRYAKALLGFAQDSGKETQVYSAMAELCQGFDNVSELKETLLSPLFGTDKKVELLCNACNAQKNGCDDVLQPFFALVFDNNRESMLHSMALQYGELYRESKGVLYGILTTAVPLSEQAFQNFKERISSLVNSEVELHLKTNPEIIGGFKLNLNMNMIDASVKRKLNDIAKGILDFKIE